MESLEVTGDLVGLVHNYSIENDINKLFDTIDIKNLKDRFSNKSAMKRPVRVSSSRSSGIGISESASLKQALRGLCISHASEMAAMKKSKTSSFKSLDLSKGKGSSVEVSLVPESSIGVSSSLGHKLKRSIVGTDCLYERTELKKRLKLRNASIGSSSNTKLPVLDENVCVPFSSVTAKEQEGVSTVSDMAFVVDNESSVFKSASNNPRFFVRHMFKRKLGSDSTSLSGGSSRCNSMNGHCNSPDSSLKVAPLESSSSRTDYTSRSRRKGKKTSLSSKSSIGDNRSSVSSSEESFISGSSCKRYKPHMSRDLRWKAIRYVESKQVGSLGLKHFKLLKKLGGGDIGNIYLSVLIGTNCLFALKVMNIDLLASRKKLIRAQTEKEILEILDHPFLPSLYAHFTTEKFSCLLMEYCPGGDLHVLRQKQSTRTFPEHTTRFYIAEIVLALEYLHMLGVVYRDLKPENVLVQEDGHIMLTDFDLSLKCAVNLTMLKTYQHPKTMSLNVRCINPFCLHKSLQISCFNAKSVSESESTNLPLLIVEPIDARSNSFVGTHEYLAPEIIKGEGHGSAVDWWTLGILLYELLYGKTPFKGGEDEEDILTNTISNSLNFPETPIVSSNAKDLIGRLLKKEPEERLGFEKGAAEIKQHHFFKGINWALIRCMTPPYLPKSYDMGSCNLETCYNIENESSLEDCAIAEDIVLEMF